VAYVLSGEAFGVKDGFVVMGISRIGDVLTKQYKSRIGGHE
jgi:hypothetical protein